MDSMIGRWFLGWMERELTFILADFRMKAPYQATIITMLFGCAMMITGDVKTWGSRIVWVFLAATMLISLTRCSS